MILLDAGHGAYSAGKYHCIANGKLYKHPGETFHNDGFIYEGQWNRVMLEAVVAELQRYELPVAIISEPIIDLPLKERVKIANAYHAAFPTSFLISLHANASPRHNARGYEVYTSKGDTQSDILATLHWQLTKTLLGDTITMRSDTFTDGDVDKEANLYILKHTTCPAILVEHLFFDQIDDARLLFNENIIRKFAIATAVAAREFYYGAYFKHILPR